MTETFRPIERVVEALKNAKNNKRSATFLIGAGCSVSAGIPDAKGIVQEIKETMPAAFEEANREGSPTYPHCMATLDVGPRRDLIRSYIKGSLQHCVGEGKLSLPATR